MAYAAVVSLVQTLQQVLKSDQDHYPKPEIPDLHEKLVALQCSMEKIHPVRNSIRSSVTDLEDRIRDAMYIAQDTVESFISSQNLAPKSEEIILKDLKDIVAKLDPITKDAAEMAAAIQLSIKGSKADQHAGEESTFSENTPSTKSKTPTREVKIVGQEKDQKAVMDHLINENPRDLQVVPIIGMPGIGKTTLAKSIYEHQRTKNHFDARAWVTVSQDYNVREIFTKLLRSFANRGQMSDISGSTKKDGDDDSRNNDLSQSLYEKLYGIKYLIVVDDMWDKEVWDQVHRFFPKGEKGSRILLTTRIAEVAEKAKTSSFCHQMSLLEKDDSWKLLCQNAFLEGVCPSLLEASGMEISNNCEGLPLSLTVVGGLLYKGERTLDYWKIIAEDTTAAAAAAKSEEDDHSYKEILSLSYNHLPGRLKGCFLYMGAFREDSEISVSKLIQLWVAEGLPTPPYSSDLSLEEIADRYLRDLIDRNLISARRKTTDGQTKTCGMHDTLRDLAVKNSKRESFFHSIYRYNQKDSDGRNSQRRISVHKNILMCMEEIYDSAKLIKSSRTLLYVGPHHHHPMPFVLTFDLLRVLDALTVYFISFPIELVKLIHLRYLALTYNGKIPKSVSKLRNLQVLIVRRYPKIIFTGDSLLPVEIWNMPELRHIFFTEGCLPDISGVEFLAQNSVLLPNLLTLSNVNVARLSKQVLQNVPKLKKLGIWVEEPRSLELGLDEILENLETLKFTVVNPIPGSKVDFQPKLSFPETLTKLTLSGSGIPWEDMEVIAELPNLQVLKLRELACQGPIWEPETKYFELKFLLLEALDLKYWRGEGPQFPALERLIIRHCYELEEMPTEMERIAGLQLIELVDCSDKAAEWAQCIRKGLQDPDDENKQIQLQFLIYSSWE